MKVNMPKRLSPKAFRTYVLVVLLGLIPISARIAKAQGQGIEAATSLPRVTSVNGRIEVGQIITVDVENLSMWSASNDSRKLVPFLNG